MSSTKITPSTKTTVQTAEGKIIAFGDFVSKFIVAHPKTSVVLTAIAANAAGVFFHL